MNEIFFYLYITFILLIIFIVPFFLLFLTQKLIQKLIQNFILKSGIFFSIINQFYKTITYLKSNVMNIEKIIAYISTILMLIFSIIPLSLLYYHELSWDKIIRLSLYKGNCGFILVYLLPIIAIFLASVLIIWIHNRHK